MNLEQVLKNNKKHMAFKKHIGQIVTTAQKVVIIFRQIPDDEKFCLLVDTEGLPDDLRDDFMNGVLSAQAQEKDEFATYANTNFFKDGSNMLEALHNRQLLTKIECNKVMMTPDNDINIRLDDLNAQLNAIKANPEATEEEIQKIIDSDVVVAGDDVKPSSVSKKDDGVLDDFDLARGFIAQADRMEAEAKSLRDQAYDIIPKRKLTAMLKKENAPA